MLFNSLTFFLFFAVVLAVHVAPLPWRLKKTNLLVASYLFYAAWSPPFVILLWLSTGIDWFVARAIAREDRTGQRRALLAISMLANLGLLGYFKYGGFLMDNWAALMSSVGVTWSAPGWSIVLPVGISFYTFQTMAYSLDVYLRRAEPTRSFLDFALFVTFFPQLVAGPIVRPTQLIPQFQSPVRASRDQFLWGIVLITLGLFEKMVIADGALAPAADKVFGAATAVPFSDAWLGTLAFSGQIFSDFAGYSTAAIGIALCLGFSLPDNFRFPYAAIGFSDFWRRWHISLSTWLRDYLYIPLGGNRKGWHRTQLNLMVTMLLGGLWHGAAWTFVVWGGLHGLYLGVERRLAGRFGGAPIASTFAFRLGLGLLTYFLVNLTWVFFRARDFATAWRMILAMLGFAPPGAELVLATNLVVTVLVVITGMLLVHGLMRNRSLEQVAARAPGWLTAVVWAGMVFAILITQGSGNAFIYFQF
ncbi:MAG: MBOAT family O-acyltransferase [Gemmatimonadales bacterium]|nr:MBOAT family O-acyltransferase [Gemmatimonadales bacterium]MDZ4390096.1 MBOAT family O-acyltransferase [Gemmatimonadales bacterium]